MSSLNRLGNVSNPYQGSYKKVLCVCSAGLLRSPTAAFVLSNPPFNFNTRSCGLDEDFALIIMDDVLLAWADEIVCMNNDQKEVIQQETSKPVINLNITDSYEYRNPELEKLIAENYTKETK